MKRTPLCFVILMLPLLSSGDDKKSLKEVLTFHASFDGKLEADHAAGDSSFYTLVAKKQEIGLKASEEHIFHEKGKGPLWRLPPLSLDQGTARSPSQRRTMSCFERRAGRERFSFWLRTSPDEDLDPGLHQIQSKLHRRAHSMAACFLNSESKIHAPCRLGVFADKLSWNPEGKPNKEIALADRPLITAEGHPFSRDRWTHIVFTWEGFNHGDKEGVAKLYLDGKLRGELTNWPQQYTWNLDETKINLGVKYIGGLDEVSCFSRALAGGEVESLFGLEKGVGELLD